MPEAIEPMDCKQNGTSLLDFYNSIVGWLHVLLFGFSLIRQPCHRHLAGALVGPSIWLRPAHHDSQPIMSNRLARQRNPVVAKLGCIKLRRHLPVFG